MTTLDQPHSAAADPNRDYDRGPGRGLDDVAELAREVFDPSRDIPLVLVTLDNQTGEPLLDLEHLRDALAGAARIEVLTHPADAWELSRLLPHGYAIWGGAVRLWWPHATATDPASDHPLFHPGVEHTTDTSTAASTAAAVVADIHRHLAARGYDVGLVPALPAGGPAATAGSPPELPIDNPDNPADDRDVAALLGAPTSPPADDEASALRARAEAAEELVTDLRREVRALAADLHTCREQIGSLVTPVYRHPGQQLRHEVQMHWLRSTDETIRNVRPLRNYTLGGAFLASAEPVARTAVVTAVCDVLTRQVFAQRGRQARSQVAVADGGLRPVTRPDGAIAWQCRVPTPSAAAATLLWWELPSGAVELGEVVSRPSPLAADQ